MTDEHTGNIPESHLYFPLLCEYDRSTNIYSDQKPKDPFPSRSRASFRAFYHDRQTKLRVQKNEEVGRKGSVSYHVQEIGHI